MKSLLKIVGVGLMALALPLAALAGSANAKNLNLDVAGMQTADCETKVKAALSKIEGVEVKQVDVKTGQVHVLIDPEKVTAETVINAIKAAGYTAKVHVEKTQG